MTKAVACPLTVSSHWVCIMNCSKFSVGMPAGPILCLFQNILHLTFSSLLDITVTIFSACLIKVLPPPTSEELSWAMHHVE